MNYYSLMLGRSRASVSLEASQDVKRPFEALASPRHLRVRGNKCITETLTKRPAGASKPPLRANHPSEAMYLPCGTPCRKVQFCACFCGATMGKQLVEKSKIIFLSAILIATTGLTVSPSYAADKLTPCQKDYNQRFKKEPSYKAVATSGGRSLASSSTACGFAAGYAKKQQAAKAALSQCRKNARGNNAPGACKVIELK